MSRMRDKNEGTYWGGGGRRDDTCAHGLSRWSLRLKFPQVELGSKNDDIYKKNENRPENKSITTRTFDALRCSRCACPHGRLLLQDAPFEHLQSPSHGRSSFSRDVGSGSANREASRPYTPQQRLACYCERSKKQIIDGAKQLRLTASHAVPGISVSRPTTGISLKKNTPKKGLLVLFK